MTDGPSRCPGFYVLGCALRELRESRGMSLRELAGKLGFSPSSLSNWETGERSIESGQLGWILGYLRISPAEPARRSVRAATTATTWGSPDLGRRCAVAWRQLHPGRQPSCRTLRPAAGGLR
ncbi:helix-turn-helix domain-containing protein [Amycolatopsis sp. SID8362]|uniref:helix-turn-helix domain-containing protein n=1 Tax=Amycolatopsis sp. SID8362 TaxID=2690346 RepID=UPI00136BA1C6|nr:helix-turn-helix domain-containing protein [Amycolatopsis sp. SID8362]NED43514.1 helix-turn-helix transcriptional regulator [Amycolatopsis sp. SID8362]